MIASATFSEKAPYDKIDAGVFGGITLVVVLVVVIAISVWKVKRRHIHDFLGLLFVSFTRRSIQDGTSDAKEILIYADKELFNKADTRSHKCKHCAIYVYYILTTCASCLWFIVVAVDDTVYRKTGTCNDVDVTGYNYVRFREDNNSMVDCATKESGLAVICYLFSPSLIGIGVAFSISQFICKIGDIYARCLNRSCSTCNCCSTPTCSTCTCTGNCINSSCMQTVLGLTIVLLMVAPIIWFTLTRINIITFNDYFTYGDVPMQVTMLILITVTIGMGGIFIFTNCCCCYVEEEEHYYCDVAHKHTFNSEDKLVFRCSKCKWKKTTEPEPINTDKTSDQKSGSP